MYNTHTAQVSADAMQSAIKLASLADRIDNDLEAGVDPDPDLSEQFDQALLDYRRSMIRPRVVVHQKNNGDVEIMTDSHELDVYRVDDSCPNDRVMRHNPSYLQHTPEFLDDFLANPPPPTPKPPHVATWPEVGLFCLAFVGLCVIGLGLGAGLGSLVGILMDAYYSA